MFFRRIAVDDGVGGNVAGHNGARADSGASTDADARKQHRPSANYTVIIKDRRVRVVTRVRHSWMLIVGESCVGPHEDIGAQTGSIGEEGPMLKSAPVSQNGVTSHIDIRSDDTMFSCDDVGAHNGARPDDGAGAEACGRVDVSHHTEDMTAWPYGVSHAASSGTTSSIQTVPCFVL